MPPSSWYTGSPSALPARSQSAISTALKRRDVLARLRAGENAGRAYPLEQVVDVERILAHEEAAEHADQAHASLDGIGALAVSDHPLVGVDRERATGTRAP